LDFPIIFRAAALCIARWSVIADPDGQDAQDERQHRAGIQASRRAMRLR
jgi:hypothetical protein